MTFYVVKLQLFLEISPLLTWGRCLPIFWRAYLSNGLVPPATRFVSPPHGARWRDVSSILHQCNPLTFISWSEIAESETVGWVLGSPGYYRVNRGVVTNVWRKREKQGIYGGGFKESFSPPVRWGLLDFMSVSSPPPPPPPPPPRPPPSPCPPPVAILWVQCGVLDPNRDPASAVWRAGPQPRSCEFSVACRTPTVISWVQCCVPDLNCDSASSVWRAGPQPRSCEFSVACRTPTAILRVQCGVPDPNCDPVSSVWRAGPQVLCQKICQKEWQKICQKECQKICQKKCQKDMSERCQKECQKICQKECQKICQKEW